AKRTVDILPEESALGTEIGEGEIAVAVGDGLDVAEGVVGVGGLGRESRGRGSIGHGDSVEAAVAVVVVRRKISERIPGASKEAAGPAVGGGSLQTGADGDGGRDEI